MRIRPARVAGSFGARQVPELSWLDGFTGKSILQAVGSTMTATTTNGVMLLEINAGGATNGSYAFDGNDYNLWYVDVTGGFDVRTRMRARNAANTDQPPASSFRLAGLHVASTANALPVFNFVHLVRGTVNAVQNRIEWKTNDHDGGGSNDVSAFNSIACPVAATSYVDLRMVRRTSSMQLIELYVRDPGATATIWDDSVAWSTVLAGHVDRTNNAQPPRATNGAVANLAVQLPNTLRVGNTVYANVTTHDVAGQHSQFGIRRA